MYNIPNVAGKITPQPLKRSLADVFGFECLTPVDKICYLRSHEVSVWVSVSIEFHVVCSFIKPYLLMRETHHYANHIHAIPSYTISAQIYVKSSVWCLTFAQC